VENEDQQQEENPNHKFNLRDRKKIFYSKKYGGFAYYRKGEEEGESDLESEEKENESSSKEQSQQTSMSKILRPRKVKEREEVSDDDFKLR
jgi:hypothetical protein